MNSVKIVIAICLFQVHHIIINNVVISGYGFLIKPFMDFVDIQITHWCCKIQWSANWNQALQCTALSYKKCKDIYLAFRSFVLRNLVTPQMWSSDTSPCYTSTITIFYLLFTYMYIFCQQEVKQKIQAASVSNNINKQILKNKRISKKVKLRIYETI